MTDRTIVERRLQDALEARANTVRPEDLRPAVAPRAPGRAPTARRLVVALGLAAVIVSLAFLAARHPASTPVAPTDSPSAGPTAAHAPQPAPSKPAAAVPSSARTAAARKPQPGHREPAASRAPVAAARVSG